MTTETLRVRLAAAQRALDEHDLAFLLAAGPALDAARDNVRHAARDLPVATWRPETIWRPDSGKP